MTNDQLAELASLARAATPGPWRAGRPREIVSTSEVCIDTDIGPKVLLSGNSNFIAEGERDAAFAAAANPSTVLALLDRIAELEVQNECEEHFCKGWRDQAIGLVRDVSRLERERDEAPPILGAADLVAGNRYWARHGPDMKWALIDVSNVEGIEYGMKNWQFVGPVIPPAA
ncbi:ead/Ea22-like family protein [Chromobacterium rhizoryzae]|uniref:Ead/Ea22-like family protein n=1 Tax=Chromobacterium rhizoryzae TaxID=1778675 RepID=A0AAD0RRK2_9NEIS|nr:ead/Ea22-like family protein [Chromobacterium rhizoryzae]AXT46414.1 hypothetical protein D1345_09535 [Chromobacterium rhizoryzae]